METLLEPLNNNFVSYPLGGIPLDSGRKGGEARDRYPKAWCIQVEGCEQMASGWGSPLPRPLPPPRPPHVS